MENRFQSVRMFYPAAALLTIVGWGGLVLLIRFTQPTIWQPLWMFFFLSMMAITGPLLPIIAFLNLRFATRPPATPNIFIRQIIWAGLYFVIISWLQIGRVLTPLLMILLAIGLIVIEIMLRMREISLWKPE